MRSLKYIALKMRYNSIPQIILNGLKMVGINLQPYYLFLEGISKTEMRDFKTRFDEYDIGFLGPKDMRMVSAIPDRNFTEEQLLRRLRNGQVCLGVKYHGRLAAFTWINFNKCPFEGHEFSLEEDEAYLFDAHTLIDFRGQGIAPYVRYRCYQELSKLGRIKLYSFSDRFNTSAILFKKKLNAKIVDSGIFLDAFKKWRFCFRANNYRLIPDQNLNC